MKRKFMAVFLACVFLLLCSCTNTTVKNDTNKERAQITKDFISLMDNDPELMKLVEKSIHLAYVNNPDKKLNPVQSVDEYYDFLDWSAKCMPWNILDGQDTSKLYSVLSETRGFEISGSLCSQQSNT